MNSYIFTKSGLTAVIAMIPYTFETSHPNYQKVVDAIKEERFEDVPDLANIARSVNVFSDGEITVDEDLGTISFNGEVIHNSLTERILQMMSEGFNINLMVAFLQNLMANPSKRAIDELYGFLEYGGLPITEDGCFIAYKRVRQNYMSTHDGKTDNSIGKTVSMPRNVVDDRSDHTCSTGLHFCSFEYLKSFGGERIVVLKINPRDVVSIPNDYNNTKGRACSYDVIGELSTDEFERAQTENIFTESVYQSTEDRSEDDYVDGYKEGYDDGRGKLFNYQSNEGNGNGNTYADGYNSGYRDGKGHKSRQYR